MEETLSKLRGLKRILVTGPESTGKTALVNHLAGYYGGYAIEEYARGYIEQLGRPYTFKDVEHIARQQVQEYEQEFHRKKWIFFDTWLIITRVWFQVVFNQIPGWIDDQIQRSRFDLVLLCAPDIPWVADPVRENGGKERDRLFEQYKQELDRFEMNWELITGTGDERFMNAIQILQMKLQNGTS